MSDFAELRRAVIYGSVMGSFCCEKFGVDRFRTLTREEIDARYREFQSCTGFLRSGWLVAAVSRCWRRRGGLAFFYAHGWLLYYGDAEAHLNIARRMLDSQTPGYDQFGTPWLPVPHLLMLPFVRRDAWWRSGLAGAIPSALCFVTGRRVPVRGRAARVRLARRGFGRRRAFRPESERALPAVHPHDRAGLLGLPHGAAVFHRALPRDPGRVWLVLPGWPPVRAPSRATKAGSLIPFVAL